MATIDYSYGWQKLNLAMHSLISTGDLKERLKYAVQAMFALAIIERPELHLPEEIRADYLEFVEKMSKDAFSILETLDEIELKNAAQQILGFYGTICRHQEPF